MTPVCELTVPVNQGLATVGILPPYPRRSLEQVYNIFSMGVVEYAQLGSVNENVQNMKWGLVCGCTGWSGGCLCALKRNEFIPLQVYTLTLLAAGVPASVVKGYKLHLQNMLGLVRGNVYYNLMNWYRCHTCIPVGDTSKFMETMLGVKQVGG